MTLTTKENRYNFLEKCKNVAHNHNSFIEVDGKTLLIEDGNVLRKVTNIFHVDEKPDGAEVYEAFLNAMHDGDEWSANEYGSLLYAYTANKSDDR